MKAAMRFAGCAMVLVLVLVPAMAGGQAKPAETKPVAKPAMQHDMSTMGTDTAMKHTMPGMAMDSGMKHKMPMMRMDSGMKHDMPMMGKDSKMKHDAMRSGWNEFDAFHAALMATWHPAEKADFSPAREQAVGLVKAAEAWAASKGPATCDNATSRQGIPGIVADANAYGEVVKNKGSDDAVKAALKKTHDGFEEVAMPCMMAGMKEMKGMGGMKGMDGMKEKEDMKGMPAPKKP